MYVRPPLAMGSGPLPTDTNQSVLGFNTLSFLDLAKDLAKYCCGHLYLSKDPPFLSVLPNLIIACGVTSELVSGPVTMATVTESSIVDEIIQETENVCLDDYSIEVSPDNDLSRETIAKLVVGKFFSKKVISNGTLRKAFSGFPKEVKYVLENGPWNLCCGFLLAAALSEDRKWESAELANMDIWVKDMGVPLPYMTEACIHQMAGRMGKFIQADKVRKNGVILNDFLRFQVRLKLDVPLLAGVSLPDYGQKKIWSYFKYEKSPIFCFKCGVIGHVDADYSAKKWVVTVQDGRSIPLFGSWLRDGSRLANGFALLEVESIHDRSRLKNDDPVLKEMPLMASNEALIPAKGAECSGVTREWRKMEWKGWFRRELITLSIFFVYGPPSRSARKDFWEERTMDVLALNHPWLLMGDLNTITGQQDKFGGREVEESDGSDLNDLLDATGGLDLGCVGNQFTWTNGKSFQDLIKERLDRALCDPEWMVSYPKAGLRAFAIKDSDHAPLVLDLLLDRERFHTPFRYLDAWSRDEGCKAVIQQA
ncbi:hypothetical protein F8388_006175 [Cannabis sativa]|uniref:Zinc knuckle CX2CX4HX4C domain-containing protein n=1 Tax=Cannabis sativa TaxID=3483 RepID=A0A7J6G718_CANSA|nr:hypothetical protein F8388_006175 [Cannabis sativa]